MRLPPHLYESPLFQFLSTNDLRSAAPEIPAAQIEEADRLIQLGLPPIVSVNLLSVIFGINSGIIWSFCHKPHKYYRTFTIPKGAGHRQITAPRVGLKIIQKWIGYHLSRVPVPDHVYGFVPGRSHVDAAHKHVAAQWAVSVDIANFFPTTPRARLMESLLALTYNAQSAEIIANLNTLGGFLVQGSPASPALSNICFADFDAGLYQIAQNHNCILTRYADDITFSGMGQPPGNLVQEIELVLAASPWQINNQKTEVQPLKGRIKIHGLLIKENSVRLTKGYRNKMRAYAHILHTKSLDPADSRRLSGHINYANQVNISNGFAPILTLQELSALRVKRARGGLLGRARRFFDRIKP